MPQRWRKIFLSVPFLVFAGLFVVDLLLLFLEQKPRVVRISRELVLLAVLALLFPMRNMLALFREKRIQTNLRRLFIFFTLAFACLYLARLSIETPAGRVSVLSGFPHSLGTFVAAAIATLVLLLLATILFGVAANLILYKSQKSTLRNFRLLVVALFFVAIVAAWQDASRFSLFDTGANEFLTFALISALIIGIVNAARTSWVVFLTRRQKWATFALTPIVAVLAFHFTSRLDESFVVQYSVAWTAIIGGIMFFIGLYASFATLNLLVHLPTAKIFDERVDAIKSLQDLSQSISRFMDQKTMMALITTRAAEVTNSRYAWLELYQQDSGDFLLASSVNLETHEQGVTALQANALLRDSVAQHRLSLLINDVTSDPRTALLNEWKADIGSLLAVPVLSKDHLFGILYTARKEYFSYNEFDRDLLESFANQAAIAFENAKLVEASIEKERLAQELQIARETQRKLLPKVMPRLPTMDVAAVSIAAREVGGDFYDVQLRDDKLRIVIGDVSGKGTAAAFYMAEVKGVLDALGQIYESPREILRQANRVLSGRLERNSFVTLLYAVFEPEIQRVSFARAGHSPLIWYPREEEPQMLEPAGMGIGLECGPVFDRVLEEKHLTYKEGDFFIFYTDGVVEARNAASQEFNEDGLLHVLNKNRQGHARSLQDAIVRSVEKHVGKVNMHDDLTVVVVGTRGHAAARDAHFEHVNQEAIVL